MKIKTLSSTGALEKEKTMNKKLAITTILAAAIVLSLATAYAAEVKEYKGDIIDGMCMNAHKDNLGAFVPTHTKACVLAPHCKTSGMYLYQADGSLLKFDDASSKKIVDFLVKDNSKLQVVVKAEKAVSSDTYKLVSIQNQ